MRFYFIRHGQSQNNRLWGETGSNKGRSEDPELTETGHEQARILANFLVERNRINSSNGSDFHRDLFQFTHLYTSLMVRSVKTGIYISEALGLPLIAWPEIHECGGIFLEDDDESKRIGLPGKPRSYFKQHYPSLRLPESIDEQGWWNRPFEAHEDRPIRARAVVNDLIEKHGDTNDSVAIISHGGFYMELIRTLFDLKAENAWFLMNNTAVSRFDYTEDNGMTLVYHNRSDHLPINLIT